MAIAVTCTHCGARLRFKGEYQGRAAKCLNCSQPIVVAGEKIPDHDVFISHSSKDKPVADAVCAALEARHIRCWIAPRDLLPGHVWAGDLPDAIAGARIMVLIFSANSNNSQQVLREVDVAVKENTIIMPFRIEATEMSKAMSFYISAAHWLDAINGPVEAHIATLVDTVRKLLMPSAPAGTMMNAPRPVMRTAPAASAPPAAAIPSPAASASAPRRGWGALIAIAIILCGGIGGGFYWWQQQKQPQPLQPLQQPQQAQSPPPSPPTTAIVQQPSPAPVVVAKQPSVSTAPSVVASQPRHIDLLKLVDLDRDIFWGRWSFTKEGLNCGTLAVPKRIRFPYHPPDEYDFAVDFTVQGFDGDDDFSQLCSVGDHDFAWIMATSANSVFCFSRIGDKPKDNPTAKLTALTKGQLHHSLVQVRRNGIKAFLDGQEMSSCPTIRSLSEQSDWNIGNNVLGLFTYDAVFIHKAEVIEISGPGHVIERLDSSKVGTTKWPLAGPIGSTVSLTTLTPRSVLVYSDRLLVNDAPQGDHVLVDGKPCTRYLFAHADSSLVYDIPPGAIGFRASAVSASDNKLFYCAILIDGDEALISHNVGESNGQIDIQLPIPPGSRKIELQFRGARQRISVHSIWANPEFVFAR